MDKITFFKIFIIISILASCSSRKSAFFNYNSEEKKIFIPYSQDEDTNEDFSVIKITANDIYSIIKKQKYDYYYIRIWAPWCSTSQEDIEKIIKLQNKYGEKIYCMLVTSEYEYSKQQLLLKKYEYRHKTYVISLDEYGKFPEKNLKKFTKDILKKSANKYKEHKFITHIILDKNSNILHTEFSNGIDEDIIDRLGYSE